jgi:hypothetical protein
MKKDGFELYLSKDIVQGEVVPFYVVWTDPEILDFEFNFSGFDSIVEYHNIKDEEKQNVIGKNRICLNQLNQNFYFGGLLKTIKTDIPFVKAKFDVIFNLNNGIKVELAENRTLYTTSIEISKNHELIKYPDQKFLIDIGLKGSTTIFINIENFLDSDVKLVLPKEIQTTFEKFFYTLRQGLIDLKIKYPQYEEFLDFFLLPFKPNENLSEQQFLKKVENLVNNFKPNEEFKQDFGLKLYNAANIESDMFNQVIRPLIEYFESSAAKNAFLDQPFLFVLIPPGKGLFKGKIIYQDLLERKRPLSTKTSYNKANSIDFEIIIESDKERLIPIKEAINIRRIENGNY